MCGIVGYVGDRDVSSVLLSGLWRLEYRGYDSAGIAVIDKGELFTRKVVGRLKKLADLLDKEPVGGNIGIGHTRWATHGEVSVENAHPIIDCNNEIAVVHNGIIENFLLLREELIAKGHIWRTTGDTEVIAHLIEEYYEGDLLKAVMKAAERLVGAYAICVISVKEPDKIVCARKDSPLIIGIGDGENIVASDIPALTGIAHKMIILENDEFAIVTKDSVKVYNKEGKEIQKKAIPIEKEEIEIDKGGYPTFMIKEIYEQPSVIRKNIELRLKNSDIVPFDLKGIRQLLPRIQKIFIQACGTSWHAGYVGKYLIEKYCRIHTEIDISSEFRYREPVLDGSSIVMAISQSGETADTLAALREAKSKFMKVLSIVNVETSSIARESDAVIFIKAGPEIGVASTKAYTAQLFALITFALYLGKIKRKVNKETIKMLVDELRQIPDKMERILEKEDEIIEIAKKYYKSPNFIFLGRGVNYPSALEGALKLKEISYIHATGYAAGEMKHGPIALIDENMPVVCVNPKTSVYHKMLSNMEEVKARKGRIIAILTEGDKEASKLAEDVFYIPECHEDLSPMLVALPLQLLAYHIARMRGLDVDKPRNLAKSVTVE